MSDALTHLVAICTGRLHVAVRTWPGLCFLVPRSCSHSTAAAQGYRVFPWIRLQDSGDDLASTACSGQQTGDQGLSAHLGHPGPTDPRALGSPLSQPARARRSSDAAWRSHRFWVVLGP